YLPRRPRDDLIFQGRKTDGALAAIRWRDIHPLARAGMVRPAFEAVCQVPQLGRQVLSRGRPGLSLPPEPPPEAGRDTPRGVGLDGSHGGATAAKAWRGSPR